MSVLSYQSIKKLCDGPNPIITNHRVERIRTASYDLSLGEEYYVSTERPETGTGGRRTRIGTQRLQGDHKTLEIAANQVVMVRTGENVALPNHLVGHLTLKLDILLKGLIMASQSQIDAGYQGPIFALLYNLSDEAVTLRLGDPLLRLEFAALDEPSQLPYQGEFKPDFTLSDVVDRRLTSSLNSMEAQFRRLKRIGYGAIAGGALAVLAILLGLLGPLQKDTSDAKAVSAKADRSATAVGDDIRAQADQTRSRLLDLEAKLSALERSGSTTTTTRRP